MVLPLYLAMTAAEISAVSTLPPRWGHLAWQIPDTLPPGTLLILTDDAVRDGRSPQEIAAAVAALDCSGVLLDFERKTTEDAVSVANALFEALPCPVAAPPGFIVDKGSPVFLPPCPLHVPLAEYLRPWQGRDIWLEAALQTQTITVTARGTRYGPLRPAETGVDGSFDETLNCRCVTQIRESEVRFTLFDTRDTLERKLAQAARLGAVRAVGLWQELGK